MQINITTIPNIVPTIPYFPSIFANFSNKTIILFATSGGSGFGNTVKELQDSAPNAVFVEGKVWNRVSKKEIIEWSLKQ